MVKDELLPPRRLLMAMDEKATGTGGDGILAVDAEGSRDVDALLRVNALA